MQAKFEFYPEGGPAPLTVQFQGKTPGTVSYFQWDFGDGFPTQGDWNARHTYAQPGTYLVTHTTTTQPDGETTTAEATIVVGDQIEVPTAPIAAFDYLQNMEGLNVSFMNRSTGNISSYKWDFGDGQSSQEENLHHGFPATGNYLVSLTATGPGGSNTIIAIVVVVEPIGGGNGNGNGTMAVMKRPIKKILPFALGGYLIFQNQKKGVK